MSTFQILCTTMYQKDFSKINEMNIKSDVVFGNQADCEKIEEISFNNHKAKMVTTKTRGISTNRNITMEFATADIVLFADDDMLYKDDLEQRVLEAFDELPDADVIVFGIQYTHGGIVCEERKLNNGKLPIYKVLKFGMPSVAMKKDVLKKNKMVFPELLGPGSLYTHGEDSDFLLKCYKKHLKVYSHSYIIGATNRDTTSWFEGYTEKFFYDTGAFSKSSFEYLWLPYIIYIAFHIRSDKGLSFLDKVRCMMAGYAGFKTLRSYEEWKRIES